MEQTLTSTPAPSPTSDPNTNNTSNANETEPNINSHADGFVNPYPSARESSNWRRVSIDVGGSDIDHIRSVLIRHGSLQTAINIFVKSLATYVRTNNLNLVDTNALERHIVEQCKRVANPNVTNVTNVPYVPNPYALTGVPSGRATSSPPVQESGGHGLSGTSGVCSPGQSSPNQPTAQSGEQTSKKGSKRKVVGTKSGSGQPE